MKFDLYNEKNNKLDEQLEISDLVIMSEPDEGLVHQYLLLQHTRKRRNANSLTRSEVRGGGRKPWRQKGTGRARAGSLTSPLFVGGGKSHGPRFHEISISMPLRMRRKALAATLSLQTEMINVLKAMPQMSEPKTAQAEEFVNAFGAGKDAKKALVIVDQHDDSYRNLSLSL